MHLCQSNGLLGGKMMLALLMRGQAHDKESALFASTRKDTNRGRKSSRAYGSLGLPACWAYCVCTLPSVGRPKKTNCVGQPCGLLQALSRINRFLRIWLSLVVCPLSIPLMLNRSYLRSHDASLSTLQGRGHRLDCQCRRHLAACWQRH